MGSTVLAKCECGSEQQLLIGGGKASFGKVCLFPCLCPECKRIVGVNLLDKPASCPDCHGKEVVPYDDEELCEQRGEETVASWSLREQPERDVVLTDGNYYCPTCDSFRLRFENDGLMWD
jgi:hypothetical protein